MRVIYFGRALNLGGRDPETLRHRIGENAGYVPTAREREVSVRDFDALLSRFRLEEEEENVSP